MKTLEDFLSEIDNEMKRDLIREYNEGKLELDFNLLEKAARIMRDMGKTLKFYADDSIWTDEYPENVDGSGKMISWGQMHGSKPAKLIFWKISQILNEEE